MLLTSDLFQTNRLWIGVDRLQSPIPLPESLSGYLKGENTLISRHLQVFVAGVVTYHKPFCSFTIFSIKKLFTYIRIIFVFHFFYDGRYRNDYAASKAEFKSSGHHAHWACGKCSTVTHIIFIHIMASEILFYALLKGPVTRKYVRCQSFPVFNCLAHEGRAAPLSSRAYFYHFERVNYKASTSCLVEEGRTKNSLVVKSNNICFQFYGTNSPVFYFTNQKLYPNL